MKANRLPSNDDAANKSLDVRRKQRLSATSSFQFQVRVFGFRPRQLRRWMARGYIGLTMKLGILHIIIAIVTFVIVVTLVLNLSTRHTFRMLSQDAVGGPGGTGGRGIGFSMKTWVSSDCVEVSENDVSYLNRDDAHNDFEEELKQVETIVEQTVTPTSRRVVGRAKLHGYDKVRILTLSDKEIHRVEAHSLQCALAFEKSGHSSTPSNKRVQDASIACFSNSFLKSQIEWLRSAQLKRSVIPRPLI